MTENVLEPALYIVPTPIGNMQDITDRAINVLKHADVICAEDTRHSMPLLTQIGVTLQKSKLISFHDHNETEKAEKISEIIESGKSVAIISDAGTPLISDPGYHLVATCAQKNIKVVPLPGACAAITALCASGFPTDRFLFVGFLPVKQEALHKKLLSLEKETGTMIFYEAPRRIIASMSAIAEVFNDREVVVARELTKTFETFYRAKACDMVEVLKNDPNYEKGEMVIILSPYREPEEKSVPDEALKLLKLLLAELPTKNAAQITAEYFGLKKNDLYKLALSIQDK